MILLNPGPANTTETVKRAQLAEDICPREVSFGDLVRKVRRQLVEVVHAGTDYEAVIFGGSGTAGVEAAISSVVPEDGRLLVIDNGAYGERMAEIAAAYRMPHHRLELGVGAWPELERIEAALGAAAYSHVAIVHHETTTGMLNPVAEVAKLCRARGAQLIVDAMSSYAGLRIDVAGEGIDYLVSSSNKCIQGMAGISFVIARKELLERLPVIAGRSLYLSLRDQHRFFEKSGQMRFTPPVQTFYALAQALEEFFAETGEGRYARYRACFDALDAGVRELGFVRLLPESMLSRILTAYVEPDHPRYGYDLMHDRLFEKGFTIYPGKGAKKATFRLANMGAITPEDMRSFVAALGATMKEMGVDLLYSGGAAARAKGPR